MPSKPTREFKVLKEKALARYAEGQPLAEIGKALDIAYSTVYEWCRGRRHSRSAPRRRRLADMVREEVADVTRVLLDQAKGGDVRAATLVMRLLEKVVGEEEVEHDDVRELAADELVRELVSLPDAIASEIVGLLAKAERESQGTTAGPGAAAYGEDGQSGGLPWQSGGDSSDAEQDPL